MLSRTNHTVLASLFEEACNQLPSQDMKTAINHPTGDFFYDDWELKQEYRGTVWEILYNSLPVPKGEARIIVLDPAHCYQTHADIDDRYHLNILGESCYLIDLEKHEMFHLDQDGIWYDMNAGKLHTAANFGRRARIQLVIRQLLKENKLVDPVSITLSADIMDKNDARFIFDNTVSPWLNKANKAGFINNFSHTAGTVKLDLEKSKVDQLKNILPIEFSLK